MSAFSDLFDRLSQNATTRDAGTATESCPKKRKPAVFVLVARADNAATVSGVSVELSKPTSQKKTTDGDGLARFDPAKPGRHNVTIKLTPEQEKTYAPVDVRTVTAGGETTATVIVLLSPLPSFQVVVEQADNHSPIGGIKVQIESKKSKLDGTTAPRSGIATFDRIPLGTYTVSLALTDDQKRQFILPKPIAHPVIGGTQNLLKINLPVRGRADPTLQIANPKVVLVKRDYMDQSGTKSPPHRLQVFLGVTNPFDGTGRLTCNQAAKVKLFASATGGTALSFPYSVGAAQLNLTNQGKPPFALYLEGAQPSAGMNDIELNLELQGGTVNVGAPVTDKLTAVKLKLEVFKCRPDETTAAPAMAETDQLGTGRYLHEQNPELHHERARILVHKAEPAAFTGKLRLLEWDEPWEAAGERLEIFSAEVAATGQAAIAFPVDLANSAIPGTGQEYWVQGKKVSEDLVDTTLRLTLDNLPDASTHVVEGHRARFTVLKTDLEIHQSRTDPAKDPLPMSADDKVKKGRYLHTQNAGFHHGRALVLVRKVKPAAFNGKLTLRVWDVTAKSFANPRVELYDAEVPASGQTAKADPFDITCDNTFPAKGLKLWAQGKDGKVSGALRDTEIRLGLKDHLRVCGRAAVTVVRFKNFKADIPSTPAQTTRNRWNGGPSNTPVPRHEFIAGTNDPAKHFSDDFAVNTPLPLVEGSVTAGDPVKLSIEVEPNIAEIPVAWSAIRAKDDAAAIKNLAGNNEDPGLVVDGANSHKATMQANAAGSFRVRAYIDCNGNNKFDERTDTVARLDREPFILMNLVLFRAQGISNTSVANSNAVCAGYDGNGVKKAGGGRPVGFKSGEFATDGNGAVHMKALIRVIGGGADGKRGLDCFFAGWVNNELNCPTAPNPNNWGEDATHHHQRPAPPGSPVLGLRCYWELDGVRISGPILDAGGRYGNQRGTGGDTCIGTMAGAEPAIVKTDDPSGIGQRWKVENVDSPGGPIASVHPNDGAARLIRFKFNIDFQCALLVWTNASKSPGPADHSACRLYSSVQTNTWNIRFESTFDPAWAETRVVRRTVTFNPDGSPTRLAAPVQGSGFETRAPGGLNCGKYDQPFDPANPNNP